MLFLIFKVYLNDKNQKSNRVFHSGIIIMIIIIGYIYFFNNNNDESFLLRDEFQKSKKKKKLALIKNIILLIFRNFIEFIRAAVNFLNTVTSSSRMRQLREITIIFKPP